MTVDYHSNKSARYFLVRYHRATMREAIEAAARIERERVLPGCEDWCRIPVDVVAIAKRRGLPLGERLDELDDRDGALLQHNDGLAISIGLGGTAGRERFTIAHEIGHSLFRNGSKHAVGVLSREERVAEDHICDRFAGALLMPIEHVRHFAKQVSTEVAWDMFMTLEGAARRFAVSLEALIVRMGEVRPSAIRPFVMLCWKYAQNRRTLTNPCLRISGVFSCGNHSSDANMDQSVSTWCESQGHTTTF